jgi:hypothetical protein
MEDHTWSSTKVKGGIPVYCITNLDGLENEKWPTILPQVPQIGQRIQSSTIHREKFQLELKVVGVTWRKYSDCDDWYAEVELHDYIDRSIYDFEDWYNRCTRGY